MFPGSGHARIAFREGDVLPAGSPGFGRVASRILWTGVGFGSPGTLSLRSRSSTAGLKVQGVSRVGLPHLAAATSLTLGMGEPVPEFFIDMPFAGAVFGMENHLTRHVCGSSSPGDKVNHQPDIAQRSVGSNVWLHLVEAEKFHERKGIARRECFAHTAPLFFLQCRSVPLPEPQVGRFGHLPRLLGRWFGNLRPDLLALSRPICESGCGANRSAEESFL